VFVTVGVLVGVFVGVFVSVGVLVGVFVGVLVLIGVFVGVFVGVLVFTGVFVGVFVGVGVFDGVLVAVLVGVFVGVTVGVGVHATMSVLPAAPPPTDCPLAVPDAIRKSVQVPTVQSGAVSFNRPEQLSPGLPAGASVVAHGVMTFEVAPVQTGGLLQGTLFVTVMPVI
jgi:hypothetical protein